MYVGGIAFSVGYPTTTGAYQTTYIGGSGIGFPGNDISITKFSPDGTSLMYSTYLGGSENENPHSLVCNSNGEMDEDKINSIYVDADGIHTLQ